MNGHYILVRFAYISKEEVRWALVFKISIHHSYETSRKPANKRQKKRKPANI